MMGDVVALESEKNEYPCLGNPFRGYEPNGCGGQALYVVLGVQVLPRVQGGEFDPEFEFVLCLMGACDRHLSAVEVWLSDCGTAAEVYPVSQLPRLRSELSPGLWELVEDEEAVS